MPTWWERGGEMPSIEERVAFLEGRFADNVAATAELRASVNESRHDSNTRFTQVSASVTELRHDMNVRFTQVEARVDDLRGDMNARFTQVEARVDDLRGDMHARFGRVDANAGELRGDMNARFAALDEKLDRQFSRLLGMQVAVLLAVVTALVGAYFR